MSRRPGLTRELERFRTVGWEHLIWVFRSPFDRVTMDRLADVRKLVDDT
jgi:hypothetical protein